MNWDTLPAHIIEKIVYYAADQVEDEAEDGEEKGLRKSYWDEWLLLLEKFHSRKANHKQQGMCSYN